MEFEQIRGFYYTAKLESFTRAAEKLMLTQPAISLKVKALEECIGEKLLERVGRRVSMTSAGRLLFERAEALIGELDGLEQVVRDLKSLESGRLAIGASDTTSIYFLPELLKAYRETHPHVELAIESGYSTAMVRKVLDREVDVAVVVVPRDEPRLHVEKLFSQTFVCAIPSGHPFCDRKRVSAEEITDHELVHLGAGSATRRAIELYFAKDRRPFSVSLELSSFEIIKRYVAAGLGISIVPDRALEPAFPGVESVALQRRLGIDLGIIRRADRRLSHAAAVFIEMALAYFGVHKKTASDGGAGRN